MRPYVEWANALRAVGNKRAHYTGTSVPAKMLRARWHSQWPCWNRKKSRVSPAAPSVLLAKDICGVALPPRWNGFKKPPNGFDVSIDAGPWSDYDEGGHFRQDLTNLNSSQVEYLQNKIAAATVSMAMEFAFSRGCGRKPQLS